MSVRSGLLPRRRRAYAALAVLLSSCEAPQPAEDEYEVDDETQLASEIPEQPAEPAEQSLINCGGELTEHTVTMTWKDVATAESEIKVSPPLALALDVTNHTKDPVSLENIRALGDGGGAALLVDLADVALDPLQTSTIEMAIPVTESPATTIQVSASLVVEADIRIKGSVVGRTYSTPLHFHTVAQGDIAIYGETVLRNKYGNGALGPATAEATDPHVRRVMTGNFAYPVTPGSEP